MLEKDLRGLSRSELIEIIDVLDDDEASLDARARKRVSAERERQDRRVRFGRAVRNTVCSLVVVAAVAVLAATLFFPVVQVSGESMEPTLNDGDVIVLLKSADLHTGDLCSFNWQNKLLIKRVIAGPGDVVDIDEDGVVSVNGTALDEPYVDELARGECDLSFPYQVPENRYFVLGDHRSVSVDSRKSAIGCVGADQVVGKVVLRVWPLRDLALVG